MELSLENLDEPIKIGIMGGTFDPIHFGHLFIAQTAVDRIGLSKIIFIPTGQPPHKDHRLITNKYHRMDMVELAIQGNSKFQVSSIEIDKEETTYTIDTMRELIKYYGEKADFYFITGTDAFIKIETWKEYDKLLSLVNFVVITRKVMNHRVLDEKIELFTKEYNAKIIKIDIPVLEISSTDIRRRVKEELSIKYLLPENVEKYILENRLYKD